MMINLKAILRATTGAALIEYGMLVGLVSVVAIGSVSTLGRKTHNVFSEVATEVSSVVSAEGDQPNLTTPTTPTHRWTFTAEAWGSPEMSGYYESLNRGELKSSDQGAFPLNAAFTRADEMRVVLHGDRRAEVANATFSCSDGSSLAVADADTFELYLEYTRVFWNNSGVVFEDAKDYTCTFTLPE